MLPRSPKNRLFGSKKLQTKKKADDGSDFERAFRGAVQFALDGGFSNILELKPVQEEALLHFIKWKDVFAVLPTGCRKSLIFQIVPRVSAYLHDRGFNYPKAAVLVVVSSLTALIDAHIKELKDHANLANTKIIAARFLEIIHSRKLIGLFKAISIFLTSMEAVSLLGLPGTTKSSFGWLEVLAVTHFLSVYSTKIFAEHLDESYMWTSSWQDCSKHRQPKLCGSSLDFEFIRECMKINKIRPKFQFWTKIGIKMTYLVFVFCYLLSLRP